MYARLAGASCSEPFAFLLIFIFTFRHIYCILLLLLFSFEIYLKFLGDLFVWSKIVFLFFPISLFIYSGFQFFFSFCTLCLIEKPKRLNWKKLQQIRRTFYFFFLKENIVSEKNTHPACKIAGEEKKEIDIFFFFLFLILFQRSEICLGFIFPSV